MYIEYVHILTSPVVINGCEMDEDALYEYLSYLNDPEEVRPEAGRFRFEVTRSWWSGGGTFDEKRVYEAYPGGVSCIYAPAIYYRDCYLVLEATFDDAAFRDPEEAEAYLNEYYLCAGGRFVLNRSYFPRLLQVLYLEEFARDVAEHLERGHLVLVLASLWDASAVQLQIEPGSYQIHQITILPIVP